MQEVTFYPTTILIITSEWAFIQNKLGNVLVDSDRWETGDANESDGGEECGAVLTAIRRAKRRATRRKGKLSEAAKIGDEMVIEHDGEKTGTGGKPLPNLRLTLNGH